MALIGTHRYPVERYSASVFLACPPSDEGRSQGGAEVRMKLLDLNLLDLDYRGIPANLQNAQTSMCCEV
jgi:hypothetical protein